jgi:tRNA threonylcarbamoyladenosine biosynthesis protein TsaE
MTVYKTRNEDETTAIAQELADTLKPGDVVALYGDLGAGKSVFCRAVIRHLARIPDLVVPSPTFTLVQTYDTPGGEIWHFDLYRMNDPSEIYELGWEEALTAITLIEWPDRLGGLLPKYAKKVDIAEAEQSRSITIS